MPEHTIAENLTRLQNAKTAIGNAITAKGGTVAAGDGLEEFAADIATIPGSTTTFISSGWFNIKTKIATLEIPYGCVGVDEKGCQGLTRITNIIIPDSVTQLGDNAFEGCGFSSINLPQTLTYIGKYAFLGCSNLTEILIPASVTTIGSNAFLNCTNLAKITINKPVNSISGIKWGAPNTTQVIWTG